MVKFYVNTIIRCILLQLCFVTTVFEDLFMLIHIDLVHSFNYDIIQYE